MELPNGEFLAVGTANILTQYNSGLAVRVDANMKVLAADTMDIFGRTRPCSNSPAPKTERSMSAARWPANSINFSDGFCAVFNPNSLTVKDSVTVFNYGLDRPLSFTVTDDGSLLMSGMAPVGNIFDAEGIIRNRAFVRKFSTNGTLLWEHVEESGMFKNKFGRAYFSSAVENPLTGNIIATGNIFTGDTTQNNILDLHYTLLSPAGALLDDTVTAMPGSQNIYHTLRYDGQGNPFAYGDSVGNVLDIQNVAPLSSVFLDFNNQLYVFATSTVRNVSAAFRNAVNVPQERVADAGKFLHRRRRHFRTFPCTRSVADHRWGHGHRHPTVRPRLYLPVVQHLRYRSRGQRASAQTVLFVMVHVVQVIDPQGCTGFVIVTLMAPLSVSVEITQDILCHGGKTGRFTLPAGPGVPPHQYQLNGGPLQSSNTFSNLGAGSYIVKVVDSQNEMFSTAPIVLAEPEKLAANASLALNTLTVNASGGTPPWKYSLNGGPQQTSNTFPNLRRAITP